jgi:hypothetical protein
MMQALGRNDFSQLPYTFLFQMQMSTKSFKPFATGFIEHFPIAGMSYVN